MFKSCASARAPASIRALSRPPIRATSQQTIDILQSVLATEIVCVLRYTMNAIAATGISSDSVKEEFEQHAKEEQGHMREVAERINQLGGTPNFNPEGLLSRSASEYVGGRESGGDDQGEPGGRADRVRALSRADPILRRQGPHHARDDGRHPHQRRRARQRHARPAGGARRQADASRPTRSRSPGWSNGSDSCLCSSASRNSLLGRPPP